MAVFPCDWSMHRYPGEQRSVYVTSVFADQAETTKLRLCQTHFDAFERVCKAEMSQVSEDLAVGSSCESCGDQKAFAIFVKVFPRKAEPVYYALDCCAACSDKLRVALKVASGRAMSAR